MIRRLLPDDALDFARLRREYLLAEPLAFASSPERDPASIDAIREILEHYPESVIIGAFTPHLAGAVALYRDPQPKARHKGHIWGMYVAPSHRGRGLGSSLLDAAIQNARVLGVEWVHLSVTSAAPQARRIYERAGFVAWGTEPDALRHGDQSVDEIYMCLRLSASTVTASPPE